jgi:hypothetical protein
LTSKVRFAVFQPSRSPVAFIIPTLGTEAIVALENIVEQLEEQKDRLQKELNAVVKMIHAAGKGVQARH